jgi:hypothetical protein
MQKFINATGSAKWLNQPAKSNSYTVKKAMSDALNSDVDNSGAESKDIGVGILRSPRRLVRATVGCPHRYFAQLFLQCIHTYTLHAKYSLTFQNIGDTVQAVDLHDATEVTAGTVCTTTGRKACAKILFAVSSEN